MPKLSRWLVVYDISNHKVRSRVARTLEQRGTRVQGSVFECRLSDSARSQLVEELRNEIASDPEADVRFYHTCLDCFRTSFGFGALSQGANEGQWIVR